MNALEPWHLLILVGVVVMLFGAKRLPDSARSLARSMRIFRTEMHEAKSDIAVGEPGVRTPAVAPVAPTPASAVAATAPSAVAASAVPDGR
jgi:sec-independent protein translocase protein TatA